MGLSKKTFLYSMALAAAMVILITGYFVFMLPSLYVDYVMDNNLKSVIQLQKGYMEKRSYEGLVVNNPSAAFSLEIPYEGTELYAAGKFFRLTAAVQDEPLRRSLQTLQSRLVSVWETDSETIQWDELWEGQEGTDLIAIWNQIQERFVGETLIVEEFPIRFQLESRDGEGVYQEEYGRFHGEENNLFVYEMGVSDGDYEYTTYLAFGQTEDALILTILPTMTPQMEEIRPIVMGSMPMIIAVVFLFVMVASQLFARRIVHPIIQLAGYAESARWSDGFAIDVFDSDSADEIGILTRTLHDLYERLRENYVELEKKNLALAEENERQEVFLRASSHQLKTPVTAAMLLVDGMIQKVGKYSDTETYLPAIREQLMSMWRIVEDILALNDYMGHRRNEMIDLWDLAGELAKRYEIQAESRELQILLSGEGRICTDWEMMEKILDNLFSNAVQYTPPGGWICVEMDRQSLRIMNGNVTIEDELLPHIFDPFVSGAGYRRGKGLGLYVASYYSRVLGFHLELYNQKDSVCAELSFEHYKGGRKRC